MIRFDILSELSVEISHGISSLIWFLGQKSSAAHFNEVLRLIWLLTYFSKFYYIQFRPISAGS